MHGSWALLAHRRAIVGGAKPAHLASAQVTLISRDNDFTRSDVEYICQAIRVTHNHKALLQYRTHAGGVVVSAQVLATSDHRGRSNTGDSDRRSRKPASDSTRAVKLQRPSVQATDRQLSLP